MICVFCEHEHTVHTGTCTEPLCTFDHCTEDGCGCTQFDEFDFDELVDLQPRRKAKRKGVKTNE
jgi:hypothetical protein